MPHHSTSGTAPLALTVKEFSRAVNQCARKVYQDIAAGKIKSYKSGRSRRIPSTEATRYIADRMAEAEAAS